MSVDIFHRLIVAAGNGLSDAEGFVARVNEQRKVNQLEDFEIDSTELDNVARAIAVFKVCIASDVLRTWDAHDVISSIRDLRNACPDASSDVYHELSRIHNIAKGILDQVGRSHLAETGNV